jgi:glycosyltransferase involved in cell wall biosynthesis
VLLYFCNVGWFFISHRLTLAQAAKAQGYDVHVACDIESTQEIEAIERAGFKFHRVRLSRGGLNPLADLRTFSRLLALLIRYRPAIAHNITIKPVLYGSIAARIAGVRGIVNSISGLGYVFIDGRRAAITRRLVRAVYRIALRSPTVRVIFQNGEDMRHFVDTGLLTQGKSVLIAGSGVDLQAFCVVPEPTPPPIRIVLPARMLTDKGVQEFAAASLALQAAGLPVECLLAGGLDSSNPAALSADQVRALERNCRVRWLGHVADMASLFQSAHIVCLPSYREGLPKALIEACAAGRPIVTTDVAGCRDVVRDGMNGLLVPPRDAHALYIALARLVSDDALRSSMGALGRKLAEDLFGIEQVIDRTLSLYREMVAVT